MLAQIKVISLVFVGDYYRGIDKNVEKRNYELSEAILIFADCLVVYFLQSIHS
jgi:hypothetical protein